jgi:ferric-dicitrate binding protein FerR (iron transport regulator)
MLAPLSLTRLLAIAAVAAPLAAFAAEDGESVGVVDKVEPQAEIVSLGNAVAAHTGMPVRLRRELRTGPSARLKLTFRDGSELTLGEKASVIIDRYVYDPKSDVGETVLQATRGAFRFATGRIKALKQKKIAVSTPVADIGVRGTEFWGGALNGATACCCSTARSWSPTKPAASCCRRKAKAPTSPLRSIRPVPFAPGAPKKSPAPWPQ